MKRQPAILLLSRFICLVASGTIWSLPTKAAADDHIYVDVEVNRKAVPMMFHTGISLFVLPPEAASFLGLNPTLSLPREHPTRTCEISVLGKTLTVPFQVLDWKTNHVVSTNTGIIGWQILRTNTFEIDARSRKISLQKKKFISGNGWQVFTIEPATDALTLNLPTTNGGRIRLLVDTSSSLGVKLGPAAWSAWNSTHTNAPHTLHGVVSYTGKALLYNLTWATDLSIGSLHLENVPVCAIPREGPAGVDAAIGRAALRGLRFVVNGAKNEAYVSPLASPPLMFPHNRLGAVFVPEENMGGGLTAHVAFPSPASRAGIKDHDVLVRINSVELTPLQTSQGYPLANDYPAQASRKELLLTVKRGNELLEKKVVLQQILPPDQD